MSIGDEHTAAVDRAVLEDQSLEERADYLRRGREHSGLLTEAVKELWVASFRAWVSDRTQDRERALDDAKAELDLRGEGPSFGMVHDEIEHLRKELREAGPNSPEVRDTIVAFVRKLRGQSRSSRTDGTPPKRSLLDRSPGLDVLFVGSKVRQVTFLALRSHPSLDFCECWQRAE